MAILSVSALTEILQRLERLESAQQLGLGHPPITRRIHCKRSHGCLWYFWDGGKKEALPIEAPAVTGYVRELRVEQGEYKNQATYNLLLTLDCGPQWFILDAGATSTFARGLILALAHLTPEQLRQPITVAPQAGDEEKVLLCRVWSGRDVVKADWPSDSEEFRPLLRDAIANVTTAQEQAF